MDQRTLIIVLAIHRVSSGALFWLIGRSMPARSGVGRWALGALMFGLSYAGRWFTPEPPWWLMVALDSAMVAAALLFFTGLREFVGRPAGHWPLLFGALALAAARKLDIHVPGAKVPLHCTVRIGISSRCGQRADWERCWAEADRALYAAKAAGRDRIVTASALRADRR